MSETSERYAKLAGAFEAKVAAVPEDRWESPTPCPEWSVRDLVGHVVDSHGAFLGFVGRELGDIPPVTDDPFAAFAAARKVVQSDLDDPERAAATFEGFSGTSSFEQGIDRFICADLVVHGWDLARATGQDERIDPVEVQRVTAMTEGVGDALRSPGAFGPAIEPPGGADEQTRLLAFLGRRAW